MGIHQLSKVLAEHCPNAIRTTEIKNYAGTKIAIDASMCLYQFLIAIRLEGNTLMDDNNETTSHLMGIFYRTLRMIDNGIKPVYVFDGKPPSLKSDELLKRTERREDAEKQLEVAQKEDNAENIDKFSRRLVKVLPKHNEESKKLLSLMGIPFINAPCEAEAQCAAMVKAKKVFAVGTEDMDALTFGGNVLLRRLTASEAKKLPIQEHNLEKILNQMEITMDQFVDLCILLGCDYCPSIRGIGPKKAVELIKKYQTLESIIENLDSKKYPVPENWDFKGARQLFLEPEITDPETIELKWSKPDEEAIVEYMCKEKNFNEDRIRSGVQRLIKARSTKTNSRIDSFFKVTEKAESAINKRPAKIDEKSCKKAKPAKIPKRK